MLRCFMVCYRRFPYLSFLSPLAPLLLLWLRAEFENLATPSEQPTRLRILRGESPLSLIAQFERLGKILDTKTYWSPLHADHVTITLAVHPLKGLVLPVRQWLRLKDEPYVDVLHPEGWTVRVPLSWTDRGPPTVVPEVDGQPVKLDLDGLSRLARYVRRKLDTPAPRATEVANQAMDGELEQRVQQAVESRGPADPAAELGRGRSRRPPSSAQRVGLAVAKNASNNSSRRGGER